jgi:hypothetical protein
MLLLWIFWIEIPAFSGYMLWSLWNIWQNGPLSGSQWAGVVVYSVALIYGLYGFIRFLGRRLAARSAQTA